MKLKQIQKGWLEHKIVSGKRNRGFNHPNHDLSLLGHPCFFIDRNMMEANSSSGTQSTITLLDAR
uniref:Uncharacterized protein n=1 Tax=Vitis vinifera TaxID=29760 RepID=F6H2G1_VITVI